ncbi:MAG TPA: ATP-binding protein [Candidatus Deferrimicrobiaceae bacterium]|nr:ATP-binding protein [Candidatus Deferrimicrobiaceae bacterium]
MPRRLSIATKFFLTYFVITGAALAFAGMAGYLQFKRYAIEEADASLKNQAFLAAETFRPLLAAPAPDRETIARKGDRLGKDLDIRLTVIFPDGKVAADSEVGSARLDELENHATHPEVRDALSGRIAVSLRRSISVKKEQRYCAVPVRSDGTVVGVVRTSVSGDVLDRRLNRVRLITWGTGFAAFLLMLAGTAIRARHVTGPLEEIRRAAMEFSSGDRSRRLRVRTGDELEEVAAALNKTAAHLDQTISQLDAQKARLATLLENLSEGVFVIADGKTVRTMNREAARILGIHAVQQEGLPYAEVIRHPDLLRFIDDWKSGIPVPPTEIQVPSAGGEITARIQATTVRYASGKGTDLLFTLRDVTEEKRLARIKSDFVSNASHELRTPLTNIRGYLEALQDAAGEGSPPDPSFLEIVHANVLRMEQLVNDLLQLSRAESLHLPLGKEEIPLPVFLDRVASRHRPDADRLGKTLTVHAEDATLRADLRNLTLALSNLVDNAIKHGVEGGHIRLSGEGREGAILLAVEDDGPGIPREHLPRIFERFYRVDKARSRDLGGTGLGLSIAKHIVEAHGGSIRAESQVGKGTRFLVRIPR